MAHGTARAAAGACLGLIALQAAGSRGGAGRIASLLADANTIVQRALDPSVPAIPDRRTGSTQPPDAPYFGPDENGNWPSFNVPVPTWPSYNVPVPPR